MIKSRNLTSHTYDQKTLDEIVEQISQEYISAFIELDHKFSTLEKTE